MALSTFSVFYFGFEITSNNRFINFDEGGGELSAELEIGSFTLDEMRTQIKTAMDAAGTDTYTITISRSDRIITISSTGTFSLLLSTGSQIGASPFTLLGFTGGADTASAASHSGDSAAGFKYEPQFILQDFVDDEDFQEKIDSSVNESADGTLEVVNFGTREFTEMSIKFATNIAQDGKLIKNNPNGVTNLRTFLQEITKKNPIEFMEDIDDPDTFEKLVLEAAPGSSTGTGYRLTELVNRNLPGYYEINRLRFRVLPS